MRTNSCQINLTSSCDRETGFCDTGKQWLSDTMVSAKSSIPAYVIAESKNLIEFCRLLEMISKYRNQKLQIHFLSYGEARNSFLCRTGRKTPPPPTSCSKMQNSSNKYLSNTLMRYALSLDWTKRN